MEYDKLVAYYFTAKKISFLQKHSTLISKLQFKSHFILKIIDLGIKVPINNEVFFDYLFVCLKNHSLKLYVVQKKQNGISDEILIME
jgi:hypothetical protein